MGHPVYRVTRCRSLSVTTDSNYIPEYQTEGMGELKVNKLIVN